MSSLSTFRAAASPPEVHQWTTSTDLSAASALPPAPNAAASTAAITVLRICSSSSCASLFTRLRPGRSRRGELWASRAASALLAHETLLLSTPRVLRRAFFEEARLALARIIGRGGKRAGHRFERGRQASAAAGVDQLFGELRRNRRKTADLLCNLAGPDERVFHRRFAQQPDAKRLLRRDPAAGQCQQLHLRGTDEPCHALRAGPARAGADGRFRQPKACAAACDANVRDCGELETAAERVAVDGRDQRQPQPRPAVEYLVPALDPAAPHVERLQRRPRGNIRAHAECLVTRAGEDYAAQRLVRV